MAAIWNAEIELSLERAKKLIDEQFPRLSPADLSPLGTGWDNVAYLVNKAFVFRFPRRHIAVPILEYEREFLPLIAPHLPLPIPAPTFIGTPQPAFPFPFLGYPLIAGTTACHVAWTTEERTRNAASLASFLRDLHRIPISSETLQRAPTDDAVGRADLQRRWRKTIERLEGAAKRHPEWDVTPHIGEVERLAQTAPYGGPLCWVHGDLYARHLVVNDAKELCGVIDWGDMHVGDPALDLSIAFTFLPPEARSVFYKSYGEIDAATWDRARFRGLSYAALLMEYGVDVGDEAIRAVGEYALHTALLE